MRRPVLSACTGRRPCDVTSATGRLIQVLTAFGVTSLVFMMAMYALERRGNAFVAAFALGCALSSAYGFLSGAWPFGSVEAVWTVIALRRWNGQRINAAKGIQS
jgi:hypothetical protein